MLDLSGMDGTRGMKFTALERYAFIGMNIATLLHDLRSPLNAIAGATQLIEKFGAQDNFLNILKTGTTTLGNQIDEVVHFASGRGIGLKLGDVRLPELAAMVFSPWKSRVRVENHIPVGLSVRGDWNKLSRLLDNLVANSAEALEGRSDGKISISAELVSTHANADASSGALVQLLIRDNGPGIPRNLLGKLFQPGVTEGKAGGNGFGLYGARLLARLHGGTLHHLPSDSGAVFSLMLPQNGPEGGPHSGKQVHDSFGRGAGL